MTMNDKEQEEWNWETILIKALKKRTLPRDLDIFQLRIFDWEKNKFLSQIKNNIQINTFLWNF